MNHQCMGHLSSMEQKECSQTPTSSLILRQLNFFFSPLVHVKNLVKWKKFVYILVLRLCGLTRFFCKVLKNFNPDRNMRCHRNVYFAKNTAVGLDNIHFVNEPHNLFKMVVYSIIHLNSNGFILRKSCKISLMGGPWACP